MLKIQFYPGDLMKNLDTPRKAGRGGRYGYIPNSSLKTQSNDQNQKRRLSKSTDVT